MMSIFRTIFEKVFKKDKERSYESDNNFFGLAGIAAQTVHAGDMVRINQEGMLQRAQQQEVNFFAPPVDCSWLFRKKLKKPLIRHTFNPRYRKYKAYLERCYG